MRTYRGADLLCFPTTFLQVGESIKGLTRESTSAGLRLERLFPVQTHGLIKAFSICCSKTDFAQGRIHSHTFKCWERLIRQEAVLNEQWHVFIFSTRGENQTEEPFDYDTGRLQWSHLCQIKSDRSPECEPAGGPTRNHKQNRPKSWFHLCWLYYAHIRTSVSGCGTSITSLKSRVKFPPVQTGNTHLEVFVFSSSVLY